MHTIKITVVKVVRRKIQHVCNTKQGVALTGRNTTGPPCSVGCPTVHAPIAGSVPMPRFYSSGGRPARLLAALQTTTDASQQNNIGPLGMLVINVTADSNKNIITIQYISMKTRTQN